MGVEVSHFLFADDTLIMCDASKENLEYLNWVFMWFEACSGLKINLGKSEMIPVGNDPNLEEFAEVLGCKVGAIPTTYLGIPLEAPYKFSKVWKGVEEGFQKRLAWWKRQYLSKGGRQTLIKSTLCSLPIYYMSLFVIPKRVTARLEKIQRDFLWGGGALVNKPHLLSWSVVCLEKVKGGLGFRSLGTFSKALLWKWSWRFAIERNPLWKQVIVGKYGQEDEGWCTNGVRERHGVGVWKAIKNGWEDLKVRMRFKVGSGNRVKFWKDRWCGDVPLRDAFPDLFSIASSKDARVADSWDGGSWNPRFIRQLNDWELEEVEIFFERLYDHVSFMDTEDSVE